MPELATVNVADTKERVALELAVLIKEKSKEGNLRFDRKDWLNLYRECLLVVQGDPVKES